MTQHASKFKRRKSSGGDRDVAFTTSGHLPGLRRRHLDSELGAQCANATDSYQIINDGTSHETSSFQSLLVVPESSLARNYGDIDISGHAVGILGDLHDSPVLHIQQAHFHNNGWKSLNVLPQSFDELATRRLKLGLSLRHQKQHDACSADYSSQPNRSINDISRKANRKARRRRSRQVRARAKVGHISPDKEALATSLFRGSSAIYLDWNMATGPTKMFEQIMKLFNASVACAVIEPYQVDHMDNLLYQVYDKVADANLQYQQGLLYASHKTWAKVETISGSLFDKLTIK